MRKFKALKKYRPNVGICLFNKKGKVWIGERPLSAADKRFNIENYVWQLPQGGIDRGEDVSAAAFRELEEETGVTSAKLLAMTPGWVAYDFPPGYNRGRNSKRWRGQRQKWAAMLFEGDKSEIILDAHSDIEFVDWRWANLADIPKLVVPFKRGVYKELVTTFSPLAEFLKEQHKARKE